MPNPCDTTHDAWVQECGRGPPPTHPWCRPRPCRRACHIAGPGSNRAVAGLAPAFSTQPISDLSEVRKRQAGGQGTRVHGRGGSSPLFPQILWITLWKVWEQAASGRTGVCFALD